MKEHEPSCLIYICTCKRLLFFAVLSLFMSACGITTVGPAGPMGPQGTPGVNGLPGTPGTVITVVQFCSGASSYPSVFPEMGLCDNGTIYAILDQSNGYDYFTAIVPGQYASETTGLSCTFTVGSNCSITEE